LITENLSTLKIHKLTREQYDRELEAGRIDENALYLTPDEEIDLSPYATLEQLETKADAGHAHKISDVANLQSSLDKKVPVDRTINGKNLTSNITLSASDVGASASGHTHDGRYYTESEIDSKLSNKANASHNHSASNITSGTLSSDRLPTVPISKGGTGATTAASALTNLGITATAAELNKLDGVTASTAELNYVDGVTSNIQTQLDNKYGLVRILTSSDDCNNLTDNGIYYYSTSSVPKNAPYANAAIIEVFGADSSSSQKIQRGTRYGEAGHCSFRQLLSGTWGAWKEIAIADAVAAASHTHAATDITSGTLSSDRLPTVPISKGGTGATTVAAAQSSLKLNKSYIYSQTDSNGNTSTSGITAYPKSPGVYRVTSTSTSIGIPTNYGCLTIFNGGTYYMHLYTDSSSLYYGRTTSLVAPTWHKVVTTDDLKSSGAGMITEYNSGAISTSSVTINGFNSKVYILTICGSGGFYTSEIIDYMSIEAAGGTRDYEVFFTNDKWGTITATITSTGVKFSVSSDTETSFTFSHVRGLY
jgi:hypothetical protein